MKNTYYMVVCTSDCYTEYKIHPVFFGGCKEIHNDLITPTCICSLQYLHTRTHYCSAIIMTHRRRFASTLIHFRRGNITYICLISFRFVNNFVYSGLSLTVTMLAGNRYLNFFLYGLVEIPAYLIAWLLLLK